MNECRKRIIEKEEIERVLKNAPNVRDVKWINYGKSGYSRDIQFIVNDKVYQIEWWSNVSYLKLENDLTIVFEFVEISGTWPNSYKTNLQFYKDGETIVILPLEDYGCENCGETTRKYGEDLARWKFEQEAKGVTFIDEENE